METIHLFDRWDLIKRLACDLILFLDEFNFILELSPLRGILDPLKSFYFSSPYLALSKDFIVFHGILVNQE